MATNNCDNKSFYIKLKPGEFNKWALSNCKIFYGFYKIWYLTWSYMNSKCNGKSYIYNIVVHWNYRKFTMYYRFFTKIVAAIITELCLLYTVTPIQCRPWAFVFIRANSSSYWWIAANWAFKYKIPFQIPSHGQLLFHSHFLFSFQNKF